MHNRTKFLLNVHSEVLATIPDIKYNKPYWSLLNSLYDADMTSKQAIDSILVDETNPIAAKTGVAI